MEDKIKNGERSRQTWIKQKSLGFQNYTLRERPEFIEKVKEFVRLLKKESSQ